MAGFVKRKEQLVFGLDIGTRSIVGTVGYREDDRFVVVAQRVKEHDTRAMIDGQIHDIGKVGESIRAVKRELEEVTGETLKEVCIAAAGRVLRTVTTKVENTFLTEREVTEEDVYALSAQGVENAYDEFLRSNDMDMKFYCVGHSAIRFYMNNYPIGNLVGHKAKTIGGEYIVTFLPEDVVDGLYKAVELADLHVANLTLEPIAAIQVAIPEMYRMLNIALVDVGAGTSDISITKEGAITAYGMIPVAGDSLTEILAQHCLVDFGTAEQIKREIGVKEEIEYKDIMGLPQIITTKDALELLAPAISKMTKPVADCIKELNGDKSVSAVFVVGGGGKIPGYTELLAQELGIVKERVAVRGEEVMGKIDFLEDVHKDSLLVTPIGICLSFYEQSNNFVFVTFNDKRVKVYDNGKLAVVDVAMQAEFPNDGLFPKRGKELNYTVNGKARITRGLPGEAAVITVNGQLADIHTPIHSNDVIVVQESTAGEPAKLELSSLPEFHDNLQIMVNDKQIGLPKFVSVNGQLKSGYYEIQENDEILMLNYYTLQQIIEFMDVQLDGSYQYYVNNRKATMDSPVYENFHVFWTNEAVDEFSYEKEDADYEEPQAVEVPPAETKSQLDTDTAKETPKEVKAEAVEQMPEVPYDLTVIVNNMPITMSGKSKYVYVDIFDYINIDLSKPQGAIVTNLNGRQAEYMEQLKDGDVIDVYWKN
ncbi:MAG: cell division protein FtsA [Lachnospiraceae bacterium]|nr:cell division protein FtsA [Lachnospiraceae bacterium]